MGVSPARAAAFDILLRVERDAAYASELLHSSAYERLSTLDHGLATELVMGVLRWQPFLDGEIARASSQALPKLDLEILIALRLAVYQLRWLDHVPRHAALNESVELVKRARKRSAAPFVNAVLRKIAGNISAVGSSTAGSALSVSTIGESLAHPLWMVERWSKEYGIETARRICEYDQTVPVTAVRLRSSGAEAALVAEGIELAPGSLMKDARRVRKGNVAKTRAFRDGEVVIQDEASQLVAALVGRGARILDCCAAPGGKTLAMADQNLQSALVAAELHSHRARLMRTLVKPRDICVVVGDARQLPFAGGFDRVLADVPCSGTGTMARNPEIKWRLLLADLADLHARQVAILSAALMQVERGGRVVYSTCSLEREENEDVVEEVLAGDAGFRLVDCRGELAGMKEFVGEVSSVTRGEFLRTVPGMQECDGFFAAVMERV